MSALQRESSRLVSKRHAPSVGKRDSALRFVTRLTVVTQVFAVRWNVTHSALGCVLRSHHRRTETRTVTGIAVETFVGTIELETRNCVVEVRNRRERHRVVAVRTVISQLSGVAIEMTARAIRCQRFELPSEVTRRAVGLCVRALERQRRLGVALHVEGGRGPHVGRVAGRAVVADASSMYVVVTVDALPNPAGRFVMLREHELARRRMDRSGIVRRRMVRRNIENDQFKDRFRRQELRPARRLSFVTCLTRRIHVPSRQREAGRGVIKGRVLETVRPVTSRAVSKVSVRNPAGLGVTSRALLRHRPEVGQIAVAPVATDPEVFPVQSKPGVPTVLKLSFFLPRRREVTLTAFAEGAMRFIRGVTGTASRRSIDKIPARMAAQTVAGLMIFRKRARAGVVIERSRFESLHLMAGVARRVRAAVCLLVAVGTGNDRFEVISVQMAVAAVQPLVTAVDGHFVNGQRLQHLRPTRRNVAGTAVRPERPGVSVLVAVGTR